MFYNLSMSVLQLATLHVLLIAQIYSRASKVFAPIDDPLKDGDTEDNGKSDNAVVWKQSAMVNMMTQVQLTHVTASDR